jgi:hypothetical protein
MIWHKQNGLLRPCRYRWGAIKGWKPHLAQVQSIIQNSCRYMFCQPWRRWWWWYRYEFLFLSCLKPRRCNPGGRKRRYTRILGRRLWNLGGKLVSALLSTSTAEWLNATRRHSLCFIGCFTLEFRSYPSEAMANLWLLLKLQWHASMLITAQQRLRPCTIYTIIREVVAW